MKRACCARSLPTQILVRDQFAHTLYDPQSLPPARTKAAMTMAMRVGNWNFTVAAGVQVSFGFERVRLVEVFRIIVHGPA